MKSTLLLCCLLPLGSTLLAQHFPGNDWHKVAQPAFYGWNPEKLSQLEEYVVDSTMSTGLLLIQDGKVI